MNNEVVIRVENLWKRYGLPQSNSLINRLLRLITKQKKTINLDRESSLWALKDINFEIKRGELLGVVGLNGSGKSTLLKCLAKTSPPTSGNIFVHGRVFSMIEINAGINPELTGRENTRLLGAIMGLSAQWLDQKIPEIEAFCDLGEWFDRPAWQYSSGMLARLGFGIAVNVEADILLIDEVLAVGDMAFQKKCIDTMDGLINQGVSGLFVSHSPYQVERLCQRAILLENGVMVFCGSSKDVIHEYHKHVLNKRALANKTSHQPSINAIDLRPGSGEIRVTDLSIIDPNSFSALDYVHTGDDFIIRIRFLKKGTIGKFILSLLLYDKSNTLIACIALFTEQSKISDLENNKEYLLDCNIKNLPLVPGIYTLGINCKEAGRLVDNFVNALEIQVVDKSDVLLGTSNIGLVHIQAEWSTVKPG